MVQLDPKLALLVCRCFYGKPLSPRVSMDTRGFLRQLNEIFEMGGNGEKRVALKFGGLSLSLMHKSKNCYVLLTNVS